MTTRRVGMFASETAGNQGRTQCNPEYETQSITEKVCIARLTAGRWSADQQYLTPTECRRCSIASSTLIPVGRVMRIESFGCKLSWSVEQYNVVIGSPYADVNSIKIKV